jgi:hypothetical protein
VRIVEHPRRQKRLPSFARSASRFGSSPSGVRCCGWRARFGRGRSGELAFCGVLDRRLARSTRKLRLPFYVYMHDTWKSRCRITGDVEPVAPRLFERRVLRSARRVFAITEEAGPFSSQARLRDLRAKACIRTLKLAVATRREPNEIEHRIHFAGGIYPLMNQDAVVNLVRAIDLCESTSRWMDTVRSDRCGGGWHQGAARLVRYARENRGDGCQRARCPFCFYRSRSARPTYEIRTVFPTNCWNIW